jgi:hypothetical protein
MTKEQFMESTVANFSQVYKGKRDCCRCGCGGTYFASTYGDENVQGRSNSVDNKKVERYLRQAKKCIDYGKDYIIGKTYIDVETGKDRTLTFYFDELKITT